jgi:uncharacterized membrane protein YfcA
MNQSLRILYSSFLGIFAGFLGGLLGISGTIIMLPLLTMFSIFSSYQIAIGTVLFSFEPFGSIFALIQYAKERKIDYFIGIIIVLSYMLGSYIGAKYHTNFNEKSIKYMTAIILLILSTYMFYNAYNINP